MKVRPRLRYQHWRLLQWSLLQSAAAPPGSELKLSGKIIWLVVYDPHRIAVFFPSVPITECSPSLTRKGATWNIQLVRKKTTTKPRRDFVQNTSSKTPEIEGQITHPACVLFSCQGSSAVMLMHVNPPLLSAFSSASILPLLTLCQQSTSNGEQPTLYTSNSSACWNGLTCNSQENKILQNRQEGTSTSLKYYHFTLATK